MTSRNTCEPRVSPLKRRSNASCGSTSSERPLARGGGHRRRPAVDQALVAERLPGPGEPDPDAAAAADDDLLDRAVDRQVAGRRADALGDERAAGRAAREAAGGQEAPQRERVERAERRRAGARTRLSGGPQNSRSARRRRAAVRRRRRRATSASARELRRSRAHAMPAMRRLRANAVGWRRETSAAKSARLSESRVVRLGHARGGRVLPAVEQRDLAEHLAGPHRRDLDRRDRPGRRNEIDDAPVDDQQHRSRPPRPRATAPRPPAGPGGAGPGRAPPAPPRGRPRGAGPWRAARGLGAARASARAAVRHRGRASRSSSPPGVSAAVIIEYSGTSSHVEVSTVSGSEAISSERGASLAVIADPPSRVDVLAADRVPEAHVRQVGLEQRVLVGVPAVVEREACRHERIARRRGTGSPATTCRSHAAPRISRRMRSAEAAASASSRGSGTP